MDDKKNDFDDSEYEADFRQKEFIIFLIVTNILTFIIAGFVGPKIEREMLYKVKSNTYGEIKLNEVENFVRDNYLREVDEEDLLTGKLKGILASLKDPYSVYMTEEEFSDLLEDTHGAFGGVGVVVSVDSEKELIVVISPVEGSPGEKVGIKPGDYIIEVDGKAYGMENYKDAVKAMKGEIDSKVKLKIARNLGKENETIKEVEITRQEIRTSTVKGQMLDDGVGYIRFSSFDEFTLDEFKENMEDLEKQNLKGMIIDLRNNPGGLLDVTCDIADIFLDKGVIVSTENRNGKVDVLKSDRKKVDYPLVVLVNEGSASASEILSGALKDRERATLVGTQTFGKGVVQKLVPLGDGSGLKLTISEYLTPNGTRIDGVGIIPDILVENPEEVEIIGPENIKEDLQLQKALEELNKKIK